jgi:glucose/arabinose dehydrogenase
LQPGRLIVGSILIALGACAPPLGAAITVPDGYYAHTFVSGLQDVTSIAFGLDGWLYASRLDGQISAVRDLDGNGAADTTVTFASGFAHPLGVAERNGQIYVTSRGAVTRLTDVNGDHVADVTEAIVPSLPAGKHWTTAVAFGPDGNMYIGLGSNENLSAGAEWQATILRFTPDGLFLNVYARGLRNPYDFAFNNDGELFATDNGAAPDSSWNCFEAPDELNWIRPGRDYGFPACFGSGHCTDVSEFCSPPPCGMNDCQTGTGCTPGLTAPIMEFNAHSSSDGIAFGGAFKGFTQHDLFVAQFGQNEIVPGCHTVFGRKVVRVRVEHQGAEWLADPPVDFATGLVTPLDVIVGPDSALYVAEFMVGKIIRIIRTDTSVGVGENDPPEISAARLRFEMAPNPAAHLSRVQWAGIENPGVPVEFDVFDVSGRHLKRLAEEGTVGAAGPVWNCDDSSGRHVAPGLYFVRARAGDVVASARVLVIG